MTDFTASNGVIVREHPGAIGVRRSVEDLDPVAVPGFNKPERVQTFLDPRQWDAIAEAVRAEEDTRLGRWRSVRYPAWTAVVHVASGMVMFRHEDGEREFSVANRGERLSKWSPELQGVAREFFDAHPEPKPWHDAKPGEVWALRIANVEGEDAYNVTEDAVQGGHRLHFRCTEDGAVYAVDSPSVTAGRRIWPEVAS